MSCIIWFSWFSAVALTPAALPPPLSSQLHPIFEIPLESELSASSLDDLGQGLKHCHKSAAHFNATLKQCERLVSVAGRVLTSGLGRAFLHEPCVLSRSVVSDSVQPHGLWPARLLCPRDSPDKNTGVGCHFLLLLGI